MAPPDLERGYLDTEDDGYLEGPYLGGEFEDAFGMQVQMVVNDQKIIGQQANLIVNKQTVFGQQVNMIAAGSDVFGQQVLMQVNDYFIPYGQQVDMVLSGLDIFGMQATLTIPDSQIKGMQVAMLLSNEPTLIGMQVEAVLGTSSILGMSVKADTLRHALCDVYLEHAYLEDAYLAECMHAFMGMQVQASFLDQTSAYGMQANMVIEDEMAMGQQALMIVNTETPRGMEVEMLIREQLLTGMQAQMVINDQKNIGQQALMIVNTESPRGMQVQQVIADKYGMQSTMVIYNVTQLRLMCEFPSRGTAGLLGNNWVASSTAAGDYLPKNINTDIVEQVWRSGAGTASFSTLTCDTGIVQGVPIDTIAILGHNLTKSALVQVQGSNDNFATPANIVFNMTAETENMYYISPTFPTLAGQNRYWRFIFQDVTNPDGFIEVGTLLFGTSDIFSVAECFRNPVVNGYRHFKDELRTEGFTNVSNDRALKRFLRLSFEKLNFFKGNYRMLDDMFKFARTSLKCLVIPTPQYPSRFAVFAKLTAMPEVTHTDIDAQTGYIDIDLEWDESL
jgi:hypothetical protein